jgi:hypothetical protein
VARAEGNIAATARQANGMRILLTHHLPLEGSATGEAARALARGLAEAGHEVLCLVVEGRHNPPGAGHGFALERVRCSPGDPTADLAFDLPGIQPHPFTRLAFEDLSEFQLVEYRNALRRKLDRCVEQLNPHVIHCQHAWLFAHLALESGAPYLVTAQGPDLQIAATTPRYRRLVEQAMENAARILVHNQGVAGEVAKLFPDVQSRVQQVPSPTGDAIATSVKQHLDCYKAALNQRYGPSNWM